MSASIQTGNTPFGGAGGAQSSPGGGAFSGSTSANARPQVQSRRVSLKLGPLGLTYATDQVLWPEAPEQVAAATPAELGQAGQSSRAGQVQTAAPEASAQANAQATQQALQQAAQDAARSFSQELHQAWRRQVEERVQQAQGYGPAARQAAVAGTSSNQSAEASASATGGATRPTAKQSAMRRAIAAYLANAAEFAQTGPMLNAVA